MSSILGKLLIRYGVDMTDVDKSEGKLKGSMNNIQSHALSVGKAIAGAAGLGSIIYVGAKVADAFKSYEDSMQKVKVVSGATGEEFEKLKELARGLATETEFSADSIAQAMYELSSAGLSAADQATVLPAVLDLATAGGLELADAAETVMKSLSGFGLAGTEATHVTDVLATAVNKSMLHFEDLSLSMKYIAPIAGATGQSIEDMTAALAIMSDAGVRGEQAGTSLRAGLLRLVDPTKEVHEGLKMIGVNIDEINPSTHSLSDIMRTLSDRTKGLTKEQKNQALANIFGTEALSGMIAIVNKGPDALDELSKSLKDSGGAAKTSAEQMRESFSKQMDILKNKLMDVGLTVMEKAMPSIEKLIDKIMELADSGDLERWAEDLSEILNTAIDLFGGLMDVVTWVIDKFGGLEGALYALGAAWATVKLAAWASSIESAGVAAASGAAAAGAGQAAGAAAGAGSAGAAAGGGLVAKAAGTTLFAAGGSGIAGIELTAAASIASIAAVGAAAILVTNKYANEAKAAIEDAKRASETAHLTTGENQASSAEKAANAYKLWGSELDQTSDKFKTYKQRLADAGVAEMQAHQAAALGASGRKEALHAINAEEQRLLNLRAQASESGDSDAVARYTAQIRELQALSAEIGPQITDTVDEIQRSVAKAVTNLGEVPAEVKRALSSSVPEIRQVGVDSMGAYVEGMLTKVGIPPAEAAEMAQLTRDALNSTDPEVRSNAANTIQGMLDELERKGQLAYGEAARIGANIAAGLDPGSTPVSRIMTTMQGIINTINTKGEHAIGRALAIGKAISEALTYKESPDISYKVPDTYRRMFSNLDSVMGANMPRLASQVKMVMPVSAKSEQNVVQVTVPVQNMFGDQRSYEELGRYLEDTIKPLINKPFGKG